MDYVDWLRWPSGPVCARCGRAGTTLARGRVWRCGACDKRVSRTAGTILQDTRTPLTVWFAAAWYITADPGGVSALTMQKLLGLGSYQTAWTMLHRYRTAMVRPGREVLTGRVEVDETFIGGERPGPHGRGALGKSLVAVAVELHEPRGYGRARMRIIPNAEATSLREFLVATVEPGSTVVTDGWSSYRPACRDWFVHEAHPVAGSGKQANELLPAVHRVDALCKRWLLGTHQGRVDPEHLQSYLDEFCFRFDVATRALGARVLPAAAVRGRSATADLPATRGQPTAEEDQADRCHGSPLPTPQPRRPTSRPSLARSRHARVTDRPAPQPIRQSNG